jgi:hypothetical protein
MTEHHSGFESNFIEFSKGKENLICKILNRIIYSQCLCKRMYLVFFVSCDQSSELLTTDLYFVLNKMFLISFVLFDFGHKPIHKDFLQKRAVSEGVFRNCSLKQPFFAQLSLNQLQRSKTLFKLFLFLFLANDYTRNKQIMC